MNVWVIVLFILQILGLGIIMARWGETRDGTYGWVLLVSNLINLALLALAFGLF